MPASRKDPVLTLTPEACEQRLRTALLEITLHPQNWDQNVWVCTDGAQSYTENGWPCGTVACLAGTACIQAGVATFAPYMEAGKTWQIDPAYQQLLADNPMNRRNEANSEFDFGGLAAVLFGLMSWQASELFSTDNTLMRLWELAAVYTAGRVTLPPEFADQVREIDDSRVGAEV